MSFVLRTRCIFDTTDSASERVATLSTPAGSIQRSFEQLILAIESCNKTRLLTLRKSSSVFYKLKLICSNIVYGWRLK